MADESAFQGLRRQLVENGRQLGSLHRRASTLEERLERVVEVLAKPAEAIGFGRIEDRLTSLNVLAREDADVAAELCLAEISIMGEQMVARTTAIVRLRRRQLKRRRMEFSAAERWL